MKRCFEWDIQGLPEAAIPECEAAVAQSATSKAGREATSRLARLREKVEGKRSRAAAERAQSEAKAREAETQAEPRYRATAQELATMKSVATEVRARYQSCAAPRDRSLSQPCMTNLQRSHSQLAKLNAKLQDIPKTADGWFDLGVAISLSQNCCNCDEADARLCEKVRSNLAAAEAALKSAKPAE